VAKVYQGTGDRFLRIRRFAGVNEAVEGDARLAPGEAAVMRNFRVTAGGALRRRPGSRNVAGLMQAYTAYVDETVPAAEAVTYGLLPSPLVLWPRILADSVGRVVGDGTPVETDRDGAAGYEGWFRETESGMARLESLAVTPASGELPLDGGAADVLDRAVIARGRVDNFGGETHEEGPEALGVYERAACIDGVFRGAGEILPAERAVSETVGWVTEDVGGFASDDAGALYRYYGARTERYAAARYLTKYACVRTAYTYVYYTEGAWEIVSSGVDGPGAGYAGTASYRFNSSTGGYGPDGADVTLLAGQSGALYQTGTGVTCKRVTYTRIDDTHSRCVIAYRTARGPYTGTSYQDTVGAAVGSVVTADDEQPETADGYVFAGYAQRGGVTFTVMRAPDGTYWAYAPDPAHTETFFVCEFAWYGDRLEPRPDTAVWQWRDAASRPNDAGTRVRGLWSGRVAGRDVLCAVCGGFLWELVRDAQGAWSKTACGAVDAAGDVHLFGFDDCLYLLTGAAYLVWDGETLRSVAGYRPLVAVAVPPEGGGTALEQINALTGARRARFSPDGSAVTFTLPEQGLASVDWVRSGSTPVPAADWTADLEAGTVTFDAAPARGTDCLEIAWTVSETGRDRICAMRYAELYSGAQDSRVFLYGDGSAAAVYSGLDHEGRPRADYFPELNRVTVGDANTPLTAMIRHYDTLLAFKTDSAWAVRYDALTLADGAVTAGFWVSGVNRAVGNCAPGQARLVENRPRTLDAGSVVAWQASSFGSVYAADARNAVRISGRVQRTIRTMDLAASHTFYDGVGHEYYVFGADGTALVHSTDADAWYVYTGLDAACMVRHGDGLYFGTGDGNLRHFSDDYRDDEGAAIDAEWDSGALDFDRDSRRKYSGMLWVSLAPEAGAAVEVTAETDRGDETGVCRCGAASGGEPPRAARLRLRLRKFAACRLILRCAEPGAAATVTALDVRARYAGYVW